MSVRGIAAKETTAKETTAKETTAKETTAKEITAKEITAKETLCTEHTEVNRNTANASLLNRSIPADYRAEQTAALAAPLQQNNHAAVCSLLIFRLADEWFALSAKLCNQVLSPLTAHTLPHRSNDTLLGIVNVRGQMLLKVCLRSLLGLPSVAIPSSQSSQIGHQVSQPASQTTHPYQRTVVVEKSFSQAKGQAKETTSRAEVWVFDVDELDGIHSIALDMLESPPAGVEANAATCTRRMFLWRAHRVSWIDDACLFDALRSRAL